jgi:hypothetical protein
MVRLCVAIAAAVLGMASMQVSAKEVDLTDHDRMELRQRADSLRSGNMLGRDHTGMSDRRSVRHVRNTHATKKHPRKHSKRRHT